MIEYKEVISKSGKHIIFCNLKDLLLDFYNTKSFEEVETHLGANDEYIIHCPFCKEEGHSKHKLYIKGDLTTGHCFVCTRIFINVSDEINLQFKVPDLISNFGGLNCQPFEVVPLTDPMWSLDKFRYECDDYDQRGVDYLNSRHKYLADLYKLLGFKFLDGNVVMPFKYHGNIFYYQIRFTGKNNKIRYFFPPISKKPPYIIEHGANKKFIIVEGVYDAISCLIQAPSYTPMAVLGSSISDYQMYFLREYVPEEIVVYMDDTGKSKAIAGRLKSVIDYCPIRIIRSDGEDPEECMIRRMKKRPGSEIGWIK